MTETVLVPKVSLHASFVHPTAMAIPDNHLIMEVPSVHLAAAVREERVVGDTLHRGTSSDDLAKEARGPVDPIRLRGMTIKGVDKAKVIGPLQGH
jgi:hypothetical protein